jgi:hypothetical protein
VPNYCTVEDLLVGDMRLPAGLRPQQYVDSATNEVDMNIGFLYVTPIDVTESSAVIRPVRLLLSETTKKLASGRLILAMSTAGQRTELHAYGKRLVDEALATLKQIVSGEITLLGVPILDPDGDGDTEFSGPQIANLDAESNVEAFYDRVANPHYVFPFSATSPRGLIT